MARLPDKTALSGAPSLRSGRAIAQEDLSGIGRGISSLGGSMTQLGNQIAQQQNVVDVARAEAAKTNGFIGVENDFSQDPDYVTFGKRAPQRTGEVVNKAANLIRDPRMRERWKLSAQTDAARVNDAVRDRGVALGRQAETVAFDEALEANRRVYVDPETSDELKEKARADIAASIDTGEATGLFTPAQAQERRELFLNGADYTRGELAIESNPQAITAPLPDTIAGRAEQAMGFFQSQGWTKEQAAGIVGNLIGESRLDTGARNPGDGRDGSDSIGIGQWNGERARALKAYAGERGLDWREFGVQLAFVQHEMGTSERAAANALREATNIDEATAAFIGYERPQGWSTGNPRGGHNFDGRLKFAAQAAGQEVNPEWYKRLSPEQRQVLQDKAAKRESDMATQLAAQQKAQYEAYKDSIGLSILTGGIASEQQILGDPLLNDGDKATLLRSFRTEMEDTIATAAAMQQFAGGSLRVDPYDREGRSTVDKVFDAAAQASPDNVQALTDEMVRQTGVVPKSALNMIRQGMTSTDVNAVVQAAQAAQRISTLNPAALSRRDGGAEVQTMADDFNYLVNSLNLSPEDAARRLMEDRDPARQRERKVLAPAAKEFVKSLDEFNLAGQFDESFLGLAGNPDIGFDEGQRLGILAEFKAIAEDQFYQANGDAEVARNRAVEEMKRLYGVTNLTGSATIMKHPPERYWPTSRLRMEVDRSALMAQQQSAAGARLRGETPDAAGDVPMQAEIGSESFDYARMQLRSDLSELYPNIDMDRVQLVTTPETDAMVKRGEMPGYAVVYKDENGVLQTLPGQLWRPDIEAAREALAPVEAQEQAERVRSAERMQGIHRQQIERGDMLRQRQADTGARLRGETTMLPRMEVRDPMAGQN